MNKQILITISFFYLFSATAIAKEFSYDYVEISAGTTNSKHYDNLYSISISKPISENLSLKGRVESYYGDWNDPGEYEELEMDGYSVGAEYNNTINLSTDFIASAEYVRHNYKQTCTPTTGTCGTYSDATPSFNFVITRVGVRKNISEKTNMEVSLKNNRLSGASSVSSNQLSLRVDRDISDEYSIGLGYDLGLGSLSTNFYGVILRRYF